MVLAACVSNLVPLLAAVVAGGFSVLVFYLTRRKEIGLRRRDAYGKAWEAALAWREMVYRVRRRAADGSEDRELVGRFHDLQQQLDYHEGVLTLERPALGDTYGKLVGTYKSVCLPLLQDAWAQPGRPPTSPTSPNDLHPDRDPAVVAAREQFAKRVRQQLGVWGPFRGWRLP